MRPSQIDLESQLHKLFTHNSQKPFKLKKIDWKKCRLSPTIYPLNGIFCVLGILSPHHMFCTAQCSHCRDSAAEWQISVEIHSFPFLDFFQSWGKEKKEQYLDALASFPFSTCSLAHPTAFRACCLLLFSAHAYIFRLSLILALKSLDHSFLIS